MTKREAIAKLNRKIQVCKQCRLSKYRTKAVPGEGSVAAKIMFIGEAPGRREDELGRPFVGMAGKFLNKLLSEINLKRQHVYITSVIKCRPPRNRNPYVDEIAACQNWWIKQIEIIKPKKIVLLGVCAFKTVLGAGKLKDLRGKWIVKNHIKYLPTYHPAAGMRFSRIRKKMKKDFRKIKNFKKSAQS